VPVGNPLRVAVVGSGPAGLSAAYHVARHGHSVVLLEGEDELGGVLRTGIPEYRLPRDVLSQEILAILALGVEPRTGVFLSAEHLAALETEYDAIIIATGLQRLRKLDVGPEHAPWIDQSIAFLGAANSADGATIEGHVVVLGGGNTAMDCARTALRCGADRVTVAYRLSRQEMPAIPEEVQEAMDEGISFRFQRSPRGFIEDDWGRAAILAEVLLGDPDEDGRRQPVVTRRTERFDCDRVLLALGQSADGSLLPAGWVLRGDQVYLAGEPLAVFACGDVATAEGTVVHAIGDGHRVATLALRELGEDVPLFSRPVNKDVVPPSSIRRSYFGSRPPTTKGQLKPNLRIHSFQEVNAGLPDASEAGRCLSCGTCTLCDTCLTFCPEGVVRQAPGGYELDLEFCKGCGICVTECPRDALEMITP